MSAAAIPVSATPRSEPGPDAGRDHRTAAAAAAIEVTVTWNRIVQDVRHLTAERRADARFCAGEEPGCQLQLPVEYLAGRTRVALAEHGAAGPLVTLPPRASVERTRADGARELVVRAPGTWSTLALEPGDRIALELGPWSIAFRVATPPGRFAAARQIDWRPNVFAGFSVLMHVVFFALVGLVPPGASGLISDPSTSTNPYAKYMITPPEAPPAPPVELEEAPAAEATTDDGGGRAPDKEGRAGDRRSRNDRGRFQIAGPPDTDRVRAALERQRDTAENGGILAYLPAADAIASPFGGSPIGRDPENVLAGLDGDLGRTSFGYGALGIHGTGRGGGCTGGDCRGIGVAWGDLVGHDGKRPGGGTGPVRSLGPRRTVVPTPIPGPPRVYGSLAKDVIRRVVRRQINQIRHCYEKGLARRPDLGGRVAVKFMINGDGAVQTAAVASSSLADVAVEQCITGAIGRLTFPRPENHGVVVVTYPFNLTSAER
jgi:hypothetical protein